jgi:hypothetical protein
VHLASNRIADGRQPSEDKVDSLMRLFPDLVSVLKKIQPEEAFEILGRYKDHPIFRKDIEIILTPKGKEWVEKGLGLIREHTSANRNP